MEEGIDPSDFLTPAVDGEHSTEEEAARIFLAAPVVVPQPEDDFPARQQQQPRVDSTPQHRRGPNPMLVYEISFMVMILVVYLLSMLGCSFLFSLLGH